MKRAEGTINEGYAKSTINKRSVVVNGHKTSICLEEDFWEFLLWIAHKERRTVNEIIAEVDKERTTSNLSSNVRSWLLSYALTIDCSGAKSELGLIPDEI
jgi:predicted DNA-binding ribbon-helix-helix protein